MPVKPSESKALIPAANTPICPKVIQLFEQVPTLLDRVVSEIWNEDGTVTDTFKASIGLTVGGLAAPTNVVATDGTVASKVTITWSQVAGASTYKVLRGTSSDSATATYLVGQPSALTVDDSSGASGQTYWYFVKAVNAGGESVFSTGDSGYWGSTAATPIDYDSSQSVPVPAGWTTVGLQTWGGGGGGGVPAVFGSPGTCGSGGGGSGEYNVRTGLAVSEGDILVLVIPTAAAIGASGSLVSISRSGTTLLSSGGGIVGGGSNGLLVGSGGSGGTGGENGTPVSGTAGNPGQAVTTGGTGGPAVGTPASWGAGGHGTATAAAGSRGHVRITPNG